MVFTSQFAYRKTHLHLIAEIIPLFNVSTFMGHEEYCKPPPKKLKQPVERAGLNQVTSPLSSYKTTTPCTTTANGYGKNHTSPGGGGGGSPGSKRADRRARGSPKQTDVELQGEILLKCFGFGDGGNP